MLDHGLPARIRAKGVRFVEVAGWQTRGSSTFNPAGSVNHHTAGASRGTTPSLATVTYGRPGLPGPLCNVLQSREADGNDIAYVVAAGRANHAGTGGWRGLTGNSRVGGLEIEHTGTGTVPPARLEIAARIQAALLEAPGSPRRADLCCQHFEWAPSRKPDFRDLAPHNADSFRARVAFWIGRTATAPPETAPPPPPVPNDTGDLGMDGIFHRGEIHVFSVRGDGALIERHGNPLNPNKSNVIMPPGWCRTGAEARVKVVDIVAGSEALEYGVAALRNQGDICNWAYWTGKEWVLRGWPS